ncbi:transposase [Spirosoma utsteinense]|uniref:REP element-mobilizing transposase RayT n=1 Tax=Spirosoma utsteinense TaxID=2585773 RepID=A0ABR6W1Z4_9BACT|nr:transposase [Spirosoma utsteinense]MBC3783721.1 REP element-mobilizing transposase RayT [Spirosoma utsteinense]MBC3790136.1 REP element-mobilizing transposase RayT [Spirosoma utsteinense]
MKTEYYRRLPHLHYVGAVFFITFNLRGAIPAEVVARLAGEKQVALLALKRSGGDTEELYKEHKRHFARIDHILDTLQYGPDWLKNPSVAESVKNKLHQYDTANYELLAHCIMANHVHIVVDTAVQLDGLTTNDTITSANYTQLHVTLKHIKGGSARVANQLLDRTGAFWQPESYDHYVRNSAELQRIINYTLQNPVKAGLVETWEEWPHTYLSPAYRT